MIYLFYYSFSGLKSQLLHLELQDLPDLLSYHFLEFVVHKIPSFLAYQNNHVPTNIPA